MNFSLLLIVSNFKAQNMSHLSFFPLVNLASSRCSQYMCKMHYLLNGYSRLLVEWTDCREEWVNELTTVFTCNSLTLHRVSLKSLIVFAGRVLRIWLILPLRLRNMGLQINANFFFCIWLPGNFCYYKFEKLIQTTFFSGFIYLNT